MFADFNKKGFIGVGEFKVMAKALHMDQNLVDSIVAVSNQLHYRRLST
jgi:hypothetical protein